MAIDLPHFGDEHRSKLDKPATARKIVKMIAKGESVTATADAIGVHRNTIARWVNREEIKQWIDKQAEKYIESLPNALELSKNVIDISKKQTDKAITRGEDGEVVSVNTDFIDQKILDSALREVDNLRKAVGITPSNSSSVVIGQLVMGDNQNILAPNVQRLLDHTLGDILDITPEEATNDG